MDAVTARASRAGRTKTASEEESPKFCIFGAGAIGGMIATLLARSGATVSVVARGQTLAALNRDGVRLVINDQMLHASVQVSEDPSELGPQDDVTHNVL